ncbi:response regulator [Photobacterium aphoticum]|uniref:Chemotaxis protein CheY n=1 Tax=Photobacterium aphoticum TaxID=754436 RepID=A0A0J1GIK4_9GAMM|nr:response regulator [Photobacterium aphoticum]KLU99519.1 chemotaxis protein CheY [Photobacterium aphoticum]PSU57110.1 DNA-binding response regulator [Photobacterium aphoticum]GHA52945.1 DNA-binding response regulator [Photobacterium aphoticum]
MAKMVLVEDDTKLCALLAAYFRQQQFDVTEVNDGAEAPAVIEAVQPDIVILDLMLPGMDGLSVCKAVREHISGKILMLTASDDDIDHVACLEIGADDFVCKPIKPRVLLARVRMLLRRGAPDMDAESHEPIDMADNANAFANTSVNAQSHSTHGDAPLVPEAERERQYGALLINQRQRRCEVAGEPINLTESEFNLLWLLACRPDEVLTREYLVLETRGIQYDGLDRTIDNKIVTLRKKLGDNPSLPRKIITVRGKGYLFVPDRW